MKKILFMSITLLLMVSLTACGQTPKKNYTIVNDSDYDCSFENVSYADGEYIVSDSKLYQYSSKKNTETDTHCKPIYKNENNYTFIGKIRTTSDGDYLLYSNNGNILSVDRFGNISNYKLKNYVDINSIVKNKNLIYFYYTNTTYAQHSYYYYITDNSIYYQVDEIGGEAKIPDNEKILYHGIQKTDNYSPDGYNPDELMIITDKNKYIASLSVNNECYEYEDVQCTYELKLVKTNRYNDILNDFENNIDYFSGRFLITKDNNYYIINY